MSANYEFLFVDIRGEGQMSDGGTWRVCAFCHAPEDGTTRLPKPQPLNRCYQEEKVPFVLVGNDAFPIGPGLLKPYTMRAMTKPQQIYNYHLCRARRLLENAFGILSNRFCVFLTTIDRLADTVVEMVLAACAMHNMLRRKCPRTNDREV